MISGVEELRILWAKNIRNARKNAGITPAALARELDVRPSTISYWESGQRTPRDEHKLAIARVLRADVNVIFPLIDFEQAAS